MSESVILDYEINTSIDKVWTAITDSESLTKWMLFKKNTFKPELGHQFQLSGVVGYDGVIDCEVTEIDEPNKLAYTWSTAGVDGETQATLVTMTLQSKSDRVTVLHLEQSGFQPDARQEIAGARYGWQNMLSELDKLIAE